MGETEWRAFTTRIIWKRRHLVLERSSERRWRWICLWRSWCQWSNDLSGSLQFKLLYLRFTLKGIQQAVTNLMISAPPRLVLDPARQVVRAGDDASVMCSATSGDQPIRLEWNKDGEQRLPPSVQDNGGLLQFRGIAASDQGMYTCSGTNAAGRATAVAEVIVQG